jgi:hypothetical protein
MKLIFFSAVFLLFSHLNSFGQLSYSVKGSTLDSSANLKLSNVVVLALNAKDSILRKFVWTSDDGSFNITGLHPGKYILLLSYPGYADYEEEFKLDSVQNRYDFGKIYMILKTRLLSEVIIKSRPVAIKIKGDTTEYNARAYVIQPNSKVEDLLKQLPGIQVDKDGKITAQGQSVDKILVDGEEFFGDDPTLVTRNIRGDMVDKVQIYNKKSDQAALTGIDDEKKNKTINIQLKADKKNGYFGKLEAGVGTDSYENGEALYNYFKSKQKISAYTIDGNTGKTNLDWSDNQKYGDGGNTQVADNGDVFIFGSRDDLDSFNGRYNGSGLPSVRSGGVHFDINFDDDKQNLNVNYKIGSLNVDGERNDLVQNSLPDGLLNSNSDQSFHNYTFRQKLSISYQIKLDTSSTLKFSINESQKNNNTSSNYLTTSRNGNDTLLNSNNGSLTNNITQNLFNMSAYYAKKLKKKGRSFSVSFDISTDNLQSTGYIKSNILFYNTTGSIDSTQNTNQYKTISGISSAFNTIINYSEPISNSISLVFNYGLHFKNSSSDNETFNYSSFGTYNDLVSPSSDFFKVNLFSNEVGAFFNYKKGKSTINIGSKLADEVFNETNLTANQMNDRHFIIWDPQLQYQYSISQQQSLTFFYVGIPTNPTINQLEPVINNTDPLNIYIGNPSLRPSFNNNFNLFYNFYDVIHEQGINLGSGFAFISDQIVNNIFTDSTGKSTIQYFNLVNKTPYNYNFYASFFRKIKPLELNLGVNLNMEGNKYYDISNNILNASSRATYSGQLTISKSVQKKYDFNFAFGPTYNVNESSLQPNINGNSAGFSASGNINLYFLKKFEISPDINYTYIAPSESFPQDFQRTILDVKIYRSFLNQDNLKLALSVNDLLNQNRGFNRTTDGNVITQETYSTIKRYFMVSIIWDFNKVYKTK